MNVGGCGKARFPLDVHMQEDSPVSLVFGRCRPDDKGAEVLKGAFCKASASCSWLLSSKRGSGPAGTPEVEYLLAMLSKQDIYATG